VIIELAVYYTSYLFIHGVRSTALAGVSASVLGVFGGSSALMGILATFVVPKLVKELGILKVSQARASYAMHPSRKKEHDIVFDRSSSETECRLTIFRSTVTGRSCWAGRSECAPRRGGPGLPHRPRLTARRPLRLPWLDRNKAPPPHLTMGRTAIA